MSPPRIAVVGSFVTDLVFRVRHWPGAGETVLGSEFGMFLGGKGFNQAIACRRLGADVVMAGRVGDDEFGQRFLDKLVESGIGTEHVRRDKAGTAVACPIVDDAGENSIIAVPRANLRVTRRDVDRVAGEIARADVLMLQFEIPLKVSAYAAQLAEQHKTTVLLDPAPTSHGASELGVRVDYIVPNEIEAHMLTHRMMQAEWGRSLQARARRGVVVSLGAGGAMVYDADGLRRFAAHRVSVVDTTGAGDAFRAGLAVRLAEGATIDEAVRFAGACGALACTVMGAEPSMPERAAVEKLLAAGG
jgi:ribokinase